MRIPYASRLELVVAVALGCLNIALGTVAYSYLGLDAVVISIAFVLLYLAEIAVIGIRHRAGAKVFYDKNIHELLLENGSIILKKTSEPVIAIDSHGTVLWYNDAMRTAVGGEVNYIGARISEVFGAELDKAIGGDVKLHLGYVVKKGAELSETGKKFVAKLEQNLKRYAKF